MFRNMAAPVVKFVLKRAGGPIADQMFGKLSSCDGMNPGGQACCYDKKEAKKKNMPVCGAKPKKPTAVPPPPKPKPKAAPKPNAAPKKKK